MGRYLKPGCSIRAISVCKGGDEGSEGARALEVKSLALLHGPLREFYLVSQL